MLDDCEVTELLWDSHFFEAKVYQIKLGATIEQVEILKRIDECHNEGAELIYLIVEQELNLVALNYSFELVDRKVTFSKRIEEVSDENSLIEEYCSSQVTDQLRTLAIASGGFSRYKLDSRIPNHKFERLYEMWIENSINGELADCIFVTRESGKVTSLITCKKRNDTGQIGLVAVDENSRGKGIASELLRRVEKWCLDNKIVTLNVATQGKNQPAVRLYERNNFVISDRKYYYHLWKK